jgi:hypothetical protein
LHRLQARTHRPLAMSHTRNVLSPLLIRLRLSGKGYAGYRPYAHAGLFDICAVQHPRSQIFFKAGAGQDAPI